MKRRSERVAALGLALLALAVYVLTLCPGAYPGPSASACAGVLQILPDAPFIGHPLWACMARLVSLLPLGELPYRLNLFSALCGAGVVALLFRLTTRLLCEMMQERTWDIQMELDADDDALEQRRKRVADEATGGTMDRALHLHAMAGGAVATLAFAFCTPFWTAAVSLHPQTFDLLLLLVTGHMLAGYFLMGQRRYLMATAFLCGIGLAESVAVALVLPAIIGTLFYVGKREGQISATFFFILLCSLGVGLFLSAGALVCWVTDCGAVGLSKAKLMWILVSLARGHRDALMMGLPLGEWLMTLLQGVAPLFVVLFSMRGFSCMRNSPSYWSWAMINALLTALAAFTLLNLPGSCWSIARDSAALPILPLLGVAVTCGALYIYGAMLGCGSEDEADDDYAVSTPSPRIMGTLLATAVALIVVAAPFRNVTESNGRKGAFVDTFCRELLQAAPDVRFFVTDGTFDANLLVQAITLRRQIAVVNAHSSQTQPTNQRCATRNEAAYPNHDPAQVWLATHASDVEHIAFLTSPELCAQTGFQAVPDRLFYRGESRQERISPSALSEKHHALWKQIEPLLSTDLPHLPLLDRFHIAMRRQASRIANDLGVLCLTRNALQEADMALRHAQTLDPDNLCAFLNHYALSRKHPELSSAESMHDRIALFFDRKPIFDRLSRYETYYGELHLPTVDHLAHQLLAEGVTPHADPSDTRLMDQLVQFCRVEEIQIASAKLKSRPVELSVPDEELSAAILAYKSGKWQAAESQTRTLLKKQRYLLSAWSLLAEVLMATDRFDEVRNEVLPAMRLVTGGKDMELPDMTEGRLALRCKQPDYAVARASFARALQRNHDITEAQNQLLQCSLALGDKSRLESDCTRLLARTPDQPTANALLGSVRLCQGRLEEAEAALNISIGVYPTVTALCDLAETLRQAQRLEAAEAAARRALLLDPSFDKGWSTLAQILAERGNLEAAAAAIKAALDICKTDINLYLRCALLEKQLNHPEHVRSLLAAAEPLLKTAPSMCKDDYNKLLTSR